MPKPLVEDSAVVTAADLKRQVIESERRYGGLVASPGKSFTATLEYRDRWDLYARVTIEATRPSFGGRRFWFICPKCGTRAGKLYLPRHATEYACRKCHGLAYESQRERELQRALRRARKVRQRLGGSINLFEPFPPKPKWMRWRTWMGLAHKERTEFDPVLRGQVERLERGRRNKATERSLTSPVSHSPVNRILS